MHLARMFIKLKKSGNLSQLCSTLGPEITPNFVSAQETLGKATMPHNFQIKCKLMQ